MYGIVLRRATAIAFDSVEGGFDGSCPSSCACHVVMLIKFFRITSLQ